MNSVTVIARIKAKETAADYVRDACIKLLEPSRAERGCLLYDLHQDDEDPALFFFLESWTDHDALDDHGESQHVREFHTAVLDQIDDIEIRRMSKIAR